MAVNFLNKNFPNKIWLNNFNSKQINSFMEIMSDLVPNIKQQLDRVYEVHLKF